MSTSPKFKITNYRKELSLDSPEFSFLTQCLHDAVELYLKKGGATPLDLSITCDIPENERDGGSAKRRGDDNPEMDMEQRRKQYVAVESNYPDLLVLPEATENAIDDAIRLFEYFDLIFKDWNLGSVFPFPCVALNFHGPSGTGKTLAAHAFSKRLGKKILLASYAQIASMYVGEGSKNLEALFGAAEEQDAVLFLDEADSLLSKRIEGEKSGAEAGMNAMRAQLLICLEKYRGVVIFASNLIKNYDRAFETRLTSVEFPAPDAEGRAKIWRKHIPDEFPRDETVTMEALAEIDDICGRDIRNAVLNVAKRMANRGIEKATLEMFKESVEQIKNSRFDVVGKNATKLTKEESQALGEVYKKQREMKKAERDSFELIKDALDSLIAVRLEKADVETPEFSGKDSQPKENATTDENSTPV